jgi:transcription elongation factor Elf1
MSDRKRGENPPSSGHEGDLATNPNRTADLYARTAEGFLIAQDITCQYDYANYIACPACGSDVRVAAHIDRASEGLNALCYECTRCAFRTDVLFDISNEVYQAWLSDLLGDLYTRHFEGPPRVPAPA